jgi:CRP-like cAMP-binding protein
MQSLAARLSLTPDEVSIFQPICLAKSVRKGLDIVREGQEDRTISFLFEGSCIYYRILSDGQRHILNILISGDIFGGVNCFFDEALYSVRALTDAVIVTWNLTECSNLLDAAQPTINPAMNRMACLSASLLVIRINRVDWSCRLSTKQLAPVRESLLSWLRWLPRPWQL